jgi:glutathione synthase/RimK-type ligase-like ATP-grasp enzyme
MRKVAYLTSRSYRGARLHAGAVPAFEAPDRDLVVAAGAERGIGFETVCWDEPDLAGRGFDLALIRSCWDYHERPTQFLETLEAHESAGLRVLNSPRAVRWNARKTYLKELGPSAIETVWVDRLEPHVVAQAFDALDATEIVIKPQIGAGSRDTVRLRRNSWSEADLRDGPKAAAMIQPFLSAIATEGERSLFWFGGVYSHAIRKLPARGDWLANIPGKTVFAAEAPPAAAAAAAESARTHTPADLLYVRIDLVMGDDGRWRVIEIEAIEPYLFLAFAPEAALRLVGALAKVLG